MSWLMRRHWPLAWAGWRDLDAEHARPNENPIQRPWARTNSNRAVWLENNVLKIADGFSTPLQVGGVSYEKQPFTENWGTDFDLNIDGDIIQLQYWVGAIGPSWNYVGFQNIVGRPMIGVYRDSLSAVESMRVIVYDNVGSISTLASTQNYTGMMNRNWWKFRLLVDRDRLVRVYYNGNLLLQYWLPAQYAAKLGARALSFLNQTTAWSEQKNFRVFDHDTIFRTITQWTNTVKYDDFNRANGAVGNGWTVYGTAGQIVSNSYSTTGTTDGSRAIVVDTGVTNGAQRVESVIGGAIAPGTGADASLVLRCNAAGTEGLVANIYSSAIFIARFTGSLTAPTMIDYTSTPITISSGDKIAFSIVGDGAWVEVNGVVVLLADVNGLSPITNSWAGLRVSRRSFADSASWNDARILTP
ncbi:hypothetical protein ABZ413_29515 [Nocardia rhamnosiphila]|uniref:hypothetical protein n=1 Tax=Nocardia rhamnosiphila TaxID=426716 RepID=UPI0033E33ED7